MSKLKNLAVALVAVSVFLAIPAFAVARDDAPPDGHRDGNAGCKTGKFVGSYTHADLFADLWGDGSGVAHTLVFQLNLHSDGTADQYWTGLPDLMLSGGTGSPSVGSWVCRNDGKLVVTLISAGYGTTTDAINHPASVPNPPPVDLLMVFHARTTYLFSVTDENTLTRIQMRARRYPVPQDPSDPTGGILRPLNTTVAQYKRLVASDADLLAP